MSATEINLLKRSASSRTFVELEEKLRSASWMALVALLIIGVAIGSAYFYLTNRSAQLSQRKQDLTRQIDTQIVKEGILVSLKERSTIAGKALDAARPWGNLFPLLPAVANPRLMKTLSVDEVGRVTLILGLPSIDEAVTIVNSLVSLTGTKKMRSPQLVSFLVKDDGSVQMGISFIPVLL